MIVSEARVATPLASRYLVQLCKHFRHKIAVEYDDARGRAEFAMGVCRMEAGAGVLLLRCEAADAAALAQVESVVGQHLERFAWKEKPAVAWTPAARGPSGGRS